MNVEITNNLGPEEYRKGARRRRLCLLLSQKPQGSNRRKSREDRNGAEEFSKQEILAYTYRRKKNTQTRKKIGETERETHGQL